MKKIILLILSLIVLLMGCADKETLQAEKSIEKMEQEYRNFVSEQTQVFINGLTRIEALFGQANKYPFIVIKPEWQQNFQTEYQIMEETYNKIEDLPYVPDKFEESHKLFKEGIKLNLSGLKKTYDGYIEKSSALIDEGTLLIDTGTEKINQASKIMNKK